MIEPRSVFDNQIVLWMALAWLGISIWVAWDTEGVLKRYFPDGRKMFQTRPKALFLWRFIWIGMAVGLLHDLGQYLVGRTFR